MTNPDISIQLAPGNQKGLLLANPVIADLDFRPLVSNIQISRIFC